MALWRQLLNLPIETWLSDQQAYRLWLAWNGKSNLQLAGVVGRSAKTLVRYFDERISLRHDLVLLIQAAGISCVGININELLIESKTLMQLSCSDMYLEDVIKLAKADFGKVVKALRFWPRRVLLIFVDKAVADPIPSRDFFLDSTATEFVKRLIGLECIVCSSESVGTELWAVFVFGAPADAAKVGAVLNQIAPDLVVYVGVSATPLWAPLILRWQSLIVPFAVFPTHKNEYFIRTDALVLPEAESYDTSLLLTISKHVYSHGTRCMALLGTIRHACAFLQQIATLFWRLIPSRVFTHPMNRAMGSHTMLSSYSTSERPSLFGAMLFSSYDLRLVMHHLVVEKLFCVAGSPLEQTALLAGLMECGFSEWEELSLAPEHIASLLKCEFIPYPGTMESFLVALEFNRHSVMKQVAVLAKLPLEPELDLSKMVF